MGRLKDFWNRITGKEAIGYEAYTERRIPAVRRDLNGVAAASYEKRCA